MVDPLAAPVTDVMSHKPGQRLRPVLLQSGQVAQVPAEDYRTALGDPLAHGEQGQATVAVPLQNGRSARVPLNDVGEALKDPLAWRGPDDAPPQRAPDAEDDALSELAGAMDYAGIGTPAPAPVPSVGPEARSRRSAARRANAPADVDALGAAWDDFYGRAQEVDVQNVPATVPLATRLGGTPLPGPTQRNAVASPEPGPQQGPVFGEADTLRDAQKRAALMRGLAGAGRGMSRIGAAIAGVRPEDGASADMERGADSQVRDYLQRKQQADADKATALKAEESDPASTSSKRFQALVSRAFGSVYTPEQISQMTAADAPLVGKYGEMVRTLEDRAVGRAAEQESQQAQLTARATEAEKQRAFEGKQNAANRANAREIAGMRQEQAGDKAQEAFDRKISERNVSGYAFDPARPPSAEGAKNMAAAVKARAEIEASLNRLESDIAEHGSEMFGAKAGEMASEWMNVTNKLRMLNDMGVPNGADYLMLGKQISDPTSGAAATTSNARLLQQIKTLRSQIGRTVDATANAYGFKPAGGGPQRVGMQGNMDLEADMVTIIPPPAPDGTPRPPKQVPRGEAQRYLSAGATLANG